MKNKGILAALLITGTLITGSGVYAATSTTSTKQAPPKTAIAQCAKGFEQFGLKGKNFVITILRKHNVSDTEIVDALENRKFLIDLAKEKNIPFSEFKNDMMTAKFNSIDEAVKAGKIKQADADALKAKIKANMDKQTDYGQGKKEKGEGFKKGKGHGKHMNETNLSGV